MKNILIHGLGQNSKDWDTIKNELETREISPIVPGFILTLQKAGN